MKQAPDFTLADQNGTMHSLKEYHDKWLVLYFYPQDETPGCTAEACMFRDGRQDLIDAGAEVVGISADDQASHKKFADNHALNFTILADPGKSVIKAYDSYDDAADRTRRNTLLIDPQGMIVKTYENVSPVGHMQQIMDDLRQLSA